MSRGNGDNKEITPPSLEKKCKIPLDKLHKVWYNKDVKGRYL
jgi:hypothetical protein